MQMFKKPLNVNRIEIQGCVYNFETPGSNLRIKFFQSAVGSDVQNGKEFLKFLKPVREMLDTSQIKDIRQLVQRELDDVRIINSLVPYILNSENNLGQNGVAFFPSVLGVLMPKNYLKTLNIPYPILNSDKRENEDGSFIDFYESNLFNWSIRQYTNGNSGDVFAYASLTVDIENSDIVIIDGQHRINAFRAACDTLTSDNDVVKQLYADCPHYNNETKVNLPITLIWFENTNEDSKVEISPEIISRKLFIDVNNTVRNVATNRKILLDDTNPVNLITNQFYSKIANDYQFNIKCLSLAHLGCDVPTEASAQSSFSSLPFTYITTPERLKSVFDVFFIRSKSYSINSSNNTKSPRGRMNKYKSSIKDDSFDESSIKIMMPESMCGAIAKFVDQYNEKEVLYVNDEVGVSGLTNQNFVRQEFDIKYFNIFYHLFSEFGIFKTHFHNIEKINNDIITRNDINECETWRSVFLDVKSLFFTLKHSAQTQNKFGIYLAKIDKDFRDEFMADKYTVYDFKNRKYDTVSATDIFVSFRSQAFQIGYVQAFYEYCTLISNVNFSTIDNADLFSLSRTFVDKVNAIDISIWGNIFSFVRAIHGDFQPKAFPVITNIIIRIIQQNGEAFDANNDKKYFAPESLLFHILCVPTINEVINADFGESEKAAMELADLLPKTSKIPGKTYEDLFNGIINDNKNLVEAFFENNLGIKNVYIADIFDKLVDDLYSNLVVKK